MIRKFKTVDYAAALQQTVTIEECLAPNHLARFIVGIIALLEQTRDLIQWVGYYEAKIQREACYRELMYDYLRSLRRQVGIGVLPLVAGTDPTGAA
jgi:hypothetical protein